MRAARPASATKGTDRLSSRHVLRAVPKDVSFRLSVKVSSKDPSCTDVMADVDAEGALRPVSARTGLRETSI